MEQLKFCRICFSTNGKFYDMEKYNLISSYQGLTEVIVMESLPQLLCSFCHTLLRKFIAFKRKCITTRNLLHYALVENKNLLTKEILKDTSKKHNICLPYAIIQCQELADDSLIIVKSENEDYDSKLDLPIFDSDDEPLSKRIEEKVVKKREGKKRREEKHLKKREEKLQKCEEQYLKCEENGVKEIKNECIMFDDIFEELNTNFDNNDEFDDWGVKKSEEIDKNDFDACISKRTLTKTEQLQEILDRKKTDNYLNSCYKCEKCFRGYITKITYENHMAKHNNPVYGSFICDICHLRNKTKHKLDTHKLKFHQELFTCSICYKGFKTRAIAKLHCKWHAGVEYKCQQCEMKFNALSTLQTHVRLKHASSHCCHICGASFLNSHGVQLHIKRMHLQTILNGETETQPTTETTCTSCGVNFHNKDALLVHVDTSIDKQCDPNIRSCVECGSNFSNMNKLKNHQKIHQDTSVKCSECNKVCKSGKSYQQHYQLVHLGLKQKYSNKEQVCEVCGNTYRSKCALIAHQRSHTGERPFACAQCPKKFSVQQLLQIHTRTHTGEAPYKCAHCPKAFKHRAALNRHDRVHTGLRPYLCPNCGKAFSQSNSLKMHVRTVHLKLADPYKRRKREHSVL